MGMTTDFCRHPGNRQGCMASLVKAYEDQSMDQHCLMTGLNQSHPACGEVLRLGLEGHTAFDIDSLENRAQPSSSASSDSLKPSLIASQAALHQGYQRDLALAKNTFAAVYERLVRSVLRGLPPDQADDIFQLVFLAMEKRFRNPRSFVGILSHYVRHAAVNERNRYLKDRSETEMPFVSSRDDTDPLAEVQDPSTTWEHYLTPDLIERWEWFDTLLKKEGSFLERVLFAQGYVCSGDLNKRLATKDLLKLWDRLARVQPAEAAQLVQVSGAYRSFVRRISVVWVVAGMLRSDRIESWQLPLILGQDAGLSVEVILKQFQELAQKGVGFVDQQFSKLTHHLTILSQDPVSGEWKE